jgi:hypothetical protein
VSVPDDASLDITEAITISAWVKFDTLDRAGFVNKAPTNDAYLLFWNGVGSNLFWRINIGGTTYSATGPVDSLNQIGVWYYLVGTYDGTIMRLYQDGVEIGSLSVSGSIQTTTGNLEMGRLVNFVYPLNGIIDDVRIYNYARTPDEIRLDYNAGFAARFGPQSSCDDDPGACMDYGF